MKNSELKNNCKDEAGKVYPVVNFNDCGGKKDCVVVCPYAVFEMKPITKEDRAKLNIKGHLKTLFFPNKAYVINPEQCHACGLCVQICPEKAIQLKRYIP
ncbi:MAG: 4Fe-4S dicluster domain-containing protein [Cytophagia bacterium]|nr:4Fe-4S dicluster domain-containing protein [Cytophagia bacterium]NBW36445.1 4Fe-4S dicluster domain-containing protein [Cytophagia bacterium]